MAARFLTSRRKIQAIFALALSVLLVLPPLANVFVNPVFGAGSLTNYKVQINNSQASATNVTYSIYATATTADNIKQIDIEFCTTASGTCTAPTGMSTSSVVLATDNISGTGRTTTAPTANAIRVVITTPAAQSPLTMSLGFTGITNPSTADTTFYARTTTWASTGTIAMDYGTAAFAILTSSSIAVTASVDPNLTFTVAGVSSGGNLNGGTSNINITTTAATIPFGTLTAGTPKIGAHDVTVSTNASSGYMVTASNSAITTDITNAVLASGSANIDKFSGTNASPTTWSAPNGTTANTNTGFFGYTTEDSNLNCTGQTANRFTSSGPKWAGSTTYGAELVCNTSPVSSEQTRVGWEIEVNSIQPAGAYSGTIILIATPTY